MSQEIYRSGCWGCKRAYEDLTKNYICPKLPQHLVEYQEYLRKYD